MPVNLKGRNFLTLKDFTPEEIHYLLDLAHDLKAKKRAGIKGDLLEGKNIVLLFEKTSTRTRCSFEVGAHDEGANVTFLGMKDSQFGKKESVEDSARVFGRMFDGIEFRGPEVIADPGDVDHPHGSEQEHSRQRRPRDVLSQGCEGEHRKCDGSSTDDA